MLSSNLILLLIVILLLVVGTLLLLYFLIRRSRKVSFTPDSKVKPEAESKESTREFLQYASDLELRASFRRANQILKTHRWQCRYQVPWLLLTGESKSGKRRSQWWTLSVAITEEAIGQRQLNWYFFNEGVVMEVAGDLVLQSTALRIIAAGTRFSACCKHRRNVLDGVVLTIPCSDLLGPAELNHEEDSNSSKGKPRLETLAGSEDTWHALAGLHSVTKCGGLTGFHQFCRQLPELQTQMFGWSNSSTLETAYKPDLLTDAFESIHKHLSWLQFEIYAERDEIQDVDDLFLFPPAIQSMREPLQVYLEGLFKQSAYHESYLFRGFYFCGESGLEAVTEIATQTQTASDWADLLIRCAEQSALVGPIFLSDLFKKDF